MIDKDRARALGEAIGLMGEGIRAIGVEYARAMTTLMESTDQTWTPERIIRAAIEEHNRRMDEFNGRTHD